MTSREHFEIAEKYFSKYEEDQKDELLQKALKSYSEAIRLQPDFADAYYKRALVNGFLDELDSKYEDLNTAISIYTKLISLDVNNPGLCYKLALAHMANYQDNENTEKALNHFNKAVKLGYENSDIFFNIGEIYSESPNPSPNVALYYYNKAIELDSNKAGYYLARGDCYDLLKQSENAMVDFSKGIELCPKDWRFYNRRGELHIQLKEWDKAISDYKQFRKFYPYVRKPEIELLRYGKDGPYFEFYFDLDIRNHEFWQSNSYYLEDCIMVEFFQVFSAVKDFAFYGNNEYSPTELRVLLKKLKEHLKLLDNITDYENFFKHVESTKFLHTLIRDFDDIETSWESILHQIIEVTKNLIELISDAIDKGKYLALYGI